MRKKGKKSFRSAERTLRRAIDLTRKTHKRRAATLPLSTLTSRLALSLALQGRSADAAKMFERALGLFNELPVRPPAPYAAALQDAGRNAVAMGRMKQGARYLERALELRRNTYGETHPEVLRTIGELSNAVLGLGNVDQALRLVEDATRDPVAMDGLDPGRGRHCASASFMRHGRGLQLLLGIAT